MASGAAQQTALMTFDEFLDFVEHKPKHEKWELHDGTPVMMVGGTEGHSLLLGNLLAALHAPARRQGCRAMTSFFTRASDRSAFEPDVVLRCGPIDPRRRHAEDPVAVFEVLSPSTMRYDRGIKLERYREIPSLSQIVFVYQDSVRVESWTREGEDWNEEATVLSSLDESLSIPAIEAGLPLAAVYEDVAETLRRSMDRARQT